MLLRTYLCERVWNEFCLGKAKKEKFSMSFLWGKMVMVICFGNVLFLFSSMYGNFLNLHFLCPLIALNGHVVYSGMVGCLALMVLVNKIPAFSLLVIQHHCHLEKSLGAYPVDFGDAWTPFDYWDAADMLWRCLKTLMSRWMAVKRISPPLVAFILLVLVFFCLPLNLRLMV